MNPLIRKSLFPRVLLLALIVSPPVWSQSTASIRGRVLDMSGLAVAGAKVTLENVATSMKSTTSSDDKGDYQLVPMIPGTYNVRAEHNGFNSLLHRNVQLLVNTPRTLDLGFTGFGPIEVTIDVSANRVPGINTVDATIGNTIDSTQVRALPLEARNVGDLFNLQPGLVYTGIQDNITPDFRGGAVSGARSDQTNLTVDGVDANDQQTLTHALLMTTMSRTGPLSSMEQGKSSG